MIRAALILMLVFTSGFCVSDINVKRISRANWIELRTENFIVITDLDEETGQALVRDLEIFRFFIPYLIAKPLVANVPPLKILAIEDRRLYDAFDMPVGVNGLFIKRKDQDKAIANINRYSKENLGADTQAKHTLLHEYVHYATRNIVATEVYPLWYSEGECEYLATFQLEEQNESFNIGSLELIGRRMRSLQSRRGAKSFDDINVEKLFKTKNLEFHWREGEISRKRLREINNENSEFYARAMITYHYLKSNKSLEEMTAKYLNLVSHGIEIDAAFESAYNTTWEKLNDEVNNYVHASGSTAWRYSYANANISLPPIEVEVRALPKKEGISNVTALIWNAGSYEKEEIDELFEYANTNGAPNEELAIAAISWAQSNSGNVEELTRIYSQKFPNNQIIRAITASVKAKKVVGMLGVGHENAQEEMQALRIELRNIINTDKLNRIAHLTLGQLGFFEDNTVLLDEAANALRNARILLGSNYLEGILDDEISINILNQNFERLVQLNRYYSAISDSSWIKSGYGSFVKDMLELRELGLSNGKVLNDGIQYNDGSWYEGEVLNGFPNGAGILTTPNGTKLEGKFALGLIQDSGSLVTSNGFQYRGEFQNGVITGVGELIYGNEDPSKIRSGSFLIGQEHGLMHREFSNGDVYEESFRVGNRHGPLTIKKASGQIIKRDFFKNQMRYIVNDNLIAVGRWNDDFLLHGSATCYLINENKLEECKFNNGELVLDDRKRSE